MTAECYCGSILAALISSPRTAMPLRTVSASASGVPAATASPSVASRSFTVSTLRIFTSSAFSRATIGAGVPAGAKKPSHDDISNPGTVSRDRRHVRDRRVARLLDHRRGS